MRVITRVMASAIAGMFVLASPSTIWAQHEMSKMMQSPHHMLITAHMKNVSEFARTLRDQAVKPAALDAPFARAAVAELRHTLGAMEAIHHKSMQAMSPEMQSKMHMMMENMDKDHSALKDQVSALETDVQADTPDSKNVAAHSNALLKHLGMMSTMHDGGKAGMMNGGSEAGMKMDKKKQMN